MLQYFNLTREAGLTERGVILGLNVSEWEGGFPEARQRSSTRKEGRGWAGPHERKWQGKAISVQRPPHPRLSPGWQHSLGDACRLRLRRHMPLPPHEAAGQEGNGSSRRGPRPSAPSGLLHSHPPSLFLSLLLSFPGRKTTQLRTTACATRTSTTNTRWAGRSTAVQQYHVACAGCAGKAG